MIIDELIPDNSERRILQLQRECDAYRRAVQALQHCGSLTDVRQIAAAVLERMADYSRCCDHGKLPDEYCEVCDPPHTNREVQPELIELRARINRIAAQAAALRRVLGKHEQTIAGYAHASESHIPEVRAALSGDAGRDLLAVATAAERLVQQAPHLPAVAVYHSNVWQELVERVQRWRGEQLPGTTYVNAHRDDVRCVGCDKSHAPLNDAGRCLGCSLKENPL